VEELNRVLAPFRWRLGFERLLQFGLRGAIASGATLVGLSCAVWLLDNPEQPPLWLAAAPLFAALVLAIARWPSRRQAALAADRRLALQERLTTAVELCDGRQRSRFDVLQVRDAIGHAQGMPSVWLTFDARARNEALLAAGVGVLALASLLLPGLPHPQRLEESSAPADTFAPSELAERALPEDRMKVTRASTQPIQAIQSDAGLRSRVRQEQAEQSALDTLARALGSVSAGQQAANAIQQGKFAAARDQLQSLGDQADQLSSAAKQQLAQALQQAAAATSALDRKLADKERLAAQALGRAAYSEQRQALRSLADQVQRSGDRSVPTDQLQRDMGRLEQQTGAAHGPDTSSGLGSTSGNQNASQGAGIGTGSDPNLYGDASRLDTAGQRVQVPAKLESGAGVRPPTGSEDQSSTNPLADARTVSELSLAQQTGQVAPERNLVPGDQRSIIRGYFR
jgi:hypothetical protein